SGTAMPPEQIKQLLRFTKNITLIEQIKQLLRFTKNITLIYDADQAGQKAALTITGRALDPTDKIKYQNSPDTPLFTKSKALFGLFQARNEISRADKVYLVEGQFDVLSFVQAGVANTVCGSGTAKVYLVEGQFDVLSFVQAGVANTVCGSGTAMPPEQIKQLLRFTKNITLIYDADQAGQ
ncbi:DNA primase catalytic core, N-terminal domain, partial [Popillia japonica]